ncbi:MAG: hypothetical protein AB7D27_17380 [Desulfomicrobium sp.]
MKFRTIRKWDSVEKSENLLFFAQLLDELLFDYSLDTYKPSAMNTSLLCNEALVVINEIERGNIKKQNIQYVLDELCENLSKDKIAQKLLTIEMDIVLNTLKNKKIRIQEKKSLVEILQNQIGIFEYKQKNEELLISSIIKEDENFSEIRHLARNYITTLINVGYSSNFTYKIVQNFFYYKNNRISGNEAISDFLDYFKDESDDFCVIYRASVLCKKISDSFNKLDIDVIDNIDETGIDISKFNFLLRENEIYLVVKKIKAYDIFSAKYNADSYVEIFSKLYNLFCHKEGIDVLRDCLIVNITKNQIYKSGLSVNTMHKCIDLLPPMASEKFNIFIKNFSLNESSFKIFTKCSELHALALASESQENQMINLWIALESIIPAKAEDDEKSTILHITQSITPFLNIIYLDRLVTRLCKDIIKFKANFYNSNINKIEGDKNSVKLIKFMCLDEYKKSRELFNQEIGYYHLLRDRFAYFCKIFEDPKNVIKLLHNHNKRIEWQIVRIYRARNLIVHSGKMPSFTKILIENTHDYLDTILNRIINLASTPKIIDSIDQGFKYTELSYISYNNWLNTKDLQFDENNIYRLVFNI